MRTVRSLKTALLLAAALLTAAGTAACRQGGQSSDAAETGVKPNSATSSFSGDTTTAASLQSPVPGVAELPAVSPPQPVEAEPASTPPVLSEPVLVAEGVDLKSKTKVRIWWTKGSEVTDTEPGPFMGTFRTGIFETVSYDKNGRETSRSGLNDAFGGSEMSFRAIEPFPIRFDDYNEDGAADFTIGQWAGSNGSEYALLTVGKDGIRALKTGIYSADRRESIRYPKPEAQTFINTYYDQQKGSYMKAAYRWKEGQFIEENASEADEPGAAGVEED